MSKGTKRHGFRAVMSLILALAMLCSVSITGISAYAQSEDNTDRPMILCGGLGNYSPDSKISQTLGMHYMGGIAAGDYATEMRNRGLVTYEAVIAPFSSNWDRACELYASIKGGRVDYGKAHSEKYGHERFGRNCTGAYPKWDNEHPVDLLGFSMGAPTTRMCASLLAFGDEEEQKASPNDCSELFKGGHATMVNSVTTISGTNNGTTFADMIFNLVNDIDGDMEKTRDIVALLTGVIGIALQGTDLSSIMDPMFDQYGLQPKKGETNAAYLTRVINESSIWKSRDICWYDMTTWGAKDIQEKYPDNPNAYYFAMSDDATVQDGNGPQRTVNSNLELLGHVIPLIDILGHYHTDKTAWGEWNDAWYANDGMVNTEFQKAPFNSKVVETPERGAWVNLPTESGVEHVAVAGFYLVANAPDYAILDRFADHQRYVQSLD